MAKVGEKEKQLRKMRESQVDEPEGFAAHRLKVADAIQRGRKAFHDLGAALREIRDSKSYREKYSTFEACCREEWGISRAHAYRLINGADVMSMLAPPEDESGVSPTGDKTTDNLLPETERQTRPLTGLDKEEAEQAWEGATAKANGQPTAAQVQEAVDEVKGEPPPSEPAEPEPPPEPPAPENHELTVEDELVAALEENGKLREIVDAIEDDTEQALADLTEKYHRLDARLSQVLRTLSEAQKTATYAQGLLRKIRGELEVERNEDILREIRKLREVPA